MTYVQKLGQDCHVDRRLIFFAQQELMRISMFQNAIRQLLACSRQSSSTRYADVHQPAVPQAHASQISGVCCCSCRYAELLDPQQTRRVLHGTAASITAFVCQFVGSEQTAASLQWLQYGQRQAQRYSTAGGLIPLSRFDTELLHQKLWTLLKLPRLTCRTQQSQDHSCNRSSAASHATKAC